MDNTTKNILKIILKDMVNEIRQDDDLTIKELEEIKRKLNKDINKIIDEMYKK